jgi:hypothetical protein
MIKLRKLGVVFLLIIAISSFSMGSVSADYYNTLEFDRWYTLDDLSHSDSDFRDDLKLILQSHHTDGPNIIDGGWVDYYEHWNGYQHVGHVKPLKLGETCIWLRHGWFDYETRYYH